MTDTSPLHAVPGSDALPRIDTQRIDRAVREVLTAMGKNPDDERRCWYTAVTRAQERLTVVEGTRVEACPWV